jgi:hypothetical protein
MSEEIKMQTKITGKAAWVYKNIPVGLRSRAVEIALLLLIEDKKLRDIFFVDPEAMEEISKIDVNNIQSKPDIEEVEKIEEIEADTNKVEDKERWGFKPKNG